MIRTKDFNSPIKYGFLWLCDAFNTGNTMLEVGKTKTGKPIIINLKKVIKRLHNNFNHNQNEKGGYNVLERKDGRYI